MDPVLLNLPNQTPSAAPELFCFLNNSSSYVFSHSAVLTLINRPISFLTTYKFVSSGVADMTDVCNTKECPKATSSDTANWSEWGNWAYCSVTCGSGTKIRRRYCLKSECSGDTEEKTSCTAESPCKPVWSAWSRW